MPEVRDGNDIALVVLAAGAGTRMGGVAKALLHGRDGRTYLETIVATAREVGVGTTIVVAAEPFAAAVVVAAGTLGCRPIINWTPERGMSSSVACGFAALSDLAPSSCRAAWLWPVDHPHVAASTLRALIASLGSHAAARPVYAERGGHPPLVARSLWSSLAICAGIDGGARTVLAAADTLDVAVDDRGAIRDIDTPADQEDS